MKIHPEPMEVETKTKKKRITIPKSLRDSVWTTYNGYNFHAKCYVSWCRTVISITNFEAGHDIPASRGGPVTVENLRPICATCNRSMQDKYTIVEWSERHGKSFSMPLPQLLPSLPPSPSHMPLPSPSPPPPISIPQIREDDVVVKMKGKSSSWCICDSTPDVTNPSPRP